MLVLVLEWMDMSLDTLRRRCCASARRSVSLQTETARFLVSEVSRGLQHVHGKGLAHRDLHSGNVLIHIAELLGPIHLISPPEIEAVKLADFALAVLCPQEAPPRMSNLVSAIPVQPPECIFARGAVWETKQHPTGPPSQELKYYAVTTEYTSAVDVWAVGCLWLTLLGYDDTIPFEAESTGNVGARIVQWIGLVDADLADRLQWSIPNVWTTREGIDTGGRNKLTRQRANDLGYAAVFDHVLRYDPGERWTAEQLVRYFDTERWFGL